MFGQPRSTSSGAGLIHKKWQRARSPLPSFYRVSVFPLHDHWRQVHALSVVVQGEAHVQVLRSL